MLVEGSFHDDIESILGALKVVRRQKIAQGLLKVRSHIFYIARFLYCFV